MVAAEKRGARAPSAGADNLALVLHHEIGSVFHQLAVEPHDREGRLHFARIEIGRQQLRDRHIYQRFQPGARPRGVTYGVEAPARASGRETGRSGDCVRF